MFSPQYMPNQFYNTNGAMPDALAGYKQQYQIQPQPKPTNDIIWVQGEAGAKGYPIAPNSTVVLWDAERPTIYVKSSDSTGIPTMRILDFKERNESASVPENKYVTIEQFKEFEKKFNEYIESNSEEE